MKQYATVSTTAFPAGAILGLTAAQVKPRVHALREIREGRYEALAAVQFKAGEVIGYDGELSKAMAALVIDEKEAAGQAKAEQKRRDKSAAASAPLV